MNWRYDVTLDRNVWPACDHCSPMCKNCVYLLSSTTSEHCRRCKQNDNKYFTHAKKEFFCSYCGRPKTASAWTMLEERLSMGTLLLDQSDKE